MSEFLDKMKTYIDKGIGVSKDAVSKAGSAMQTMGENSVLHIEIKKIQNQVDKEFKLLGLAVYEMLETQNASSISKSDAQIAGSLKKIRELQIDIEQRSALLKSKGPEN